MKMSENSENGKPEAEKSLIQRDFRELVRQQSLKEDSQCGFSIFRGKFLQRFASKKAYVIVHGVVGCIFISTFAYFNGTITTMEKRFKIPSRNTGIITTGYDCASIFMAPILSHYLAKKHRPRWVSFGAFTISIYCFMMAGLHLFYGPGEDALSLTTEYGATLDQNATDSFFFEEQKRLTLCRLNSTTGVECDPEEGSVIPQFYMFFAQFFAGIFGPLYDSLGFAYMDDNIQKSKTPVLISLSYFVRMLGPAIGYTIASFSLKNYIAPNLHPIITQTDSRWIGAWWMGWLIIGIVLSLFALLVSFFPRELPRAAVRRLISIESQKSTEPPGEKKDLELNDPKKDTRMWPAFKRVLQNKIFMLNTIASVFYFFGFVPYWIFTPKYIETQYRQSASLSSFLTGTVALVFTAFGILVAGIVISKYKPSARKMAAWNVFVGMVSVAGMIGYIFLGCKDIQNSMILTQPINENLTSCISDCHCDYVKYSPICGEDGHTYISPCHAGCTEQSFFENGTKYYENCGCIEPLSNSTNPFHDFEMDYVYEGGRANLGSCAVNCRYELILFMVVMCINKFTGSSGRTSNFLISVRCVNPEDKSISMGLGTTIVSIFSFIPSPIVFGWIIDQTCSVWGKTCSGHGNCWLYDGESLRYLMNTVAACAVVMGTLCDVCVWFYVKDLKVFDDNEDDLFGNLMGKKKKVDGDGDAKSTELKNLKEAENEHNKTNGES